MNCNETRPQLPLLLYGELSFDEEEAVESHLDNCDDCRTALARERELSAAFDQVAVEPSPVLLRQSRETLFARLEHESRPFTAPVAPKRDTWWQRFVDSLAVPMHHPAGAVALLLMGFMGAQMLPQNSGLGSMGEMSIADLGPARVRSVQPAGDGTVRIVIDETHQRTLSGRMEDEMIRSLLMAAAKAQSDDLRAETVAVLTTRAQAADVRSALVYMIRNDQNDGVRLRALNGLKAFLDESEVRSVLADILATDSNLSMRKQAIDLLVEGLDSADVPQAVDPRMVGVLQQLISREDENPYMRDRCERALELVKASAEVF